MADLNTICREFCPSEIAAQFDPNTGARDLEVIAGDLLVPDQCFIRDEIRFLNNGRLIFTPSERKQYFREYFVVCRKLVVIGGHKPGDLQPCKPDDPGQMYAANNVITWEDRLRAAATGEPRSPAQAADGQSFDRNHWQNLGQGNDGSVGAQGANGLSGRSGGDGLSAPSFTLVALEVEVGIGDHLTIDWDGQNGGTGGLGQRGGNGGNGMGGRQGDSDTTWPGTGCDRQPGSGGDGGRGGDGGTGGPGGRGGNAGHIQIFSTVPNVAATGVFMSGRVSYIYDRGEGGEGGLGGFGGRGGFGGNPGFKTSECDQANLGDTGAEGFPSPGLGPGSNANQGGGGAPGGPGSCDWDPVTRDTCIDMVPMPAQVTSGPTPNIFCRGFSTPATVDATITGQFLGQVTSLGASLAGVTVTKKVSSTDTQLDLRIDLAGNSGLGNCNLILHRAFGADQTINNAFQVKRFEVISLAPNTGARNNAVNVTITGECFDASAAIQDVNVSGLGVTPQNMLVVDQQHVTCVFDIGGLAALGARDVTVRTGAMQHTLVNSFTVTA